MSETASKPFRITVFGKAGCEKCKQLNRRLDELLAKPEWGDFEKAYRDVETIDGLVAFSQMECLNPNRIPAAVVLARTAAGGYEPLPNPQPGAADAALKNSKLYTLLGIQTDYAGTGTITPPMLTSLLRQARALAAG
ncbi:MAG: hypothetical protein WC789_13140 [Lentisphaeria bacterium]|jgi:hypothetical protein